MFRDKESSNRIKLSQLVQDLLNFGVLGSLWLWGWEWLGVPHTYAHAHMCTHTHIYVKHDNFNCKWQPPLGKSLGIPYDVLCTCTCMWGSPSHHTLAPSTHSPLLGVNACAHVWMSPSHHTLAPSTHFPSLGGPPDSVKIQFNST